MDVEKLPFQWIKSFDHQWDQAPASSQVCQVPSLSSSGPDGSYTFPAWIGWYFGQKAEGGGGGGFAAACERCEGHEISESDHCRLVGS